MFYCKTYSVSLWSLIISIYRDFAPSPSEILILTGQDSIFLSYVLFQLAVSFYIVLPRFYQNFPARFALIFIYLLNRLLLDLLATSMSLVFISNFYTLLLLYIKRNLYIKKLLKCKLSLAFRFIITELLIYAHNAYQPVIRKVIRCLELVCSLAFSPTHTPYNYMQIIFIFTLLLVIVQDSKS